MKVKLEGSDCTCRDSKSGPRSCSLSLYRPSCPAPIWYILRYKNLVEFFDGWSAQVDANTLFRAKVEYVHCISCEIVTVYPVCGTQEAMWGWRWQNQLNFREVSEQKKLFHPLEHKNDRAILSIVNGRQILSFFLGGGVRRVCFASFSPHGAQ
jgi:hypothetical protein